MFSFLRDHASKNVWCSPEQDNQVILATQRITRPGGELISFPIMTRRIELPTKDRRYHVFQVGQAHPSVLGLLPRFPNWTKASWKKFSDTVEKLPLFCDLYTDSGVHLALHRAYYMYTDDRALIFAIDLTGKSPIDYQRDQIYLRLYTNAFFESNQGNSLVNKTQTNGLTVQRSSDILTIQMQILQHRSRPGQVFCFVNGHLVDEINFFTAKVGDVVEYIYDASVKRVVDLKVDSLKTFTSTLDSSYKYLLHYPKTVEEIIDYLDDIDVYVLKKDGLKYKGQYLHRNKEDALRMVTHRDYSVPVDTFEHIARSLSSLTSSQPLDLRDFYIRLYIRNSGLKRPLVYDHQRIFELYKLNDSDVLQAMVGVDAVIPEWTAAQLEHSAYTELMRTPYTSIDIDLIERAYGYNAITKVIGETPTKTRLFNGVQVVELPVGLYEKSTIYEHDASGNLINYYHHTLGTVYTTRNSNTRMIEGVSGLGSDTPSVIYGQDQITLPSIYSYRVYMCYLVDGLPNNDWRDITGSDLYHIDDQTLIWNNLESDQYLMIRTDERFLAYSLELNAVAGTYYFDLTEKVEEQYQVMTVPMGDLDIWLNGKALIQGLDYTVQFPRVVIFNKAYLKQPAGSSSQRIDIRFTGFCDQNLKMRQPEDYGFIEHGVLSNDSEFDIRDDKVLRITVRGELKHRSDLKFSEDHTGVSVVDALNGAPYQIKDVIVPLRTLTQDETYRLRARSEDLDQRIEDYMTLKYPQPERDAVSAISNRHLLYSPFFSHIVSDLASGQINKSQIERVLDENDILEICAPYEYLLETDPLNENLELDQRYVVIHPTQLNAAVGLDLHSYKFMQRVVALYGKGLIQLSPYLNVSLGG